MRNYIGMMIAFPLVFGAASAGERKADFYVATNGNDAWTGTLAAPNDSRTDGPFATLARARDAVRKMIASELTKDVLVLVRGGVYEFDEPFVLGPEDSGTPVYSITYAAFPGEQPIISGGRTISGWKKNDQNKWTVELPDVLSGEWWFRQLFADGKRLPRARFPDAENLLRVESVSSDVKSINLNQPLPSVDLSGKDAELVVFQNWSVSRASISRSSDNVVTTAKPVGWIGHSATTVSPGKPAYLEHAPAFVTQPGEWYLDRANGILTYMATDGEEPNQSQFIAPKVEQLVLIAGRKDASVRNIRIEGITFEYAKWAFPETGYSGIQAGHYGTNMSQPTFVLPLAIEYTYALDCRLERCRLAHIGASGVGFGAGCQRNKMVGCELFDIGGNGVMVGWRGKEKDGEGIELDADWNDLNDAPVANEISNNSIRVCGIVNHGCVGIWEAFSAESRIAYNLVTELPYTGISVGFRWNTSVTSQRGCIVEYNHIHDVMKILADGGGIYTLGFQPKTILRGNLIHDVHRSDFAHGGAPNNGIFFDQGSKGFLVEGNIIYNTYGQPIRFNQTGEEWHTWRDNSFGIKPDAPDFPSEAVAKAGPRNRYDAE